MIANLPDYVYLYIARICRPWRAIYFVLFLTALPYLSFAQSIIPRFETIGVNDGLSQSSVYSVYQDKKGFMWFGTADGLNRFDGHAIKVFKVKDNASANSNYVRGNTREDKQGNIWFTNETGIFCFNVAREVLTRRHALSQNDQASGVFIDNNDIFWILCTGGIAGYDINKNKWTQYAATFKLNNKNATGFRATTDNLVNIWFKNNGFGIYHFNTKSHQYRHSLANVPIACLNFNNKKIYYWCNNTLVTADTLLNTISKKHFDIAERVAMVIDILPDSYQRIWFTTSTAGILCYNLSTGKMDMYRHDNARQKSLAFDITRCLYIDRFDNLWVGTDGGGVSRLDLKPAKFNLFPLNEGDYSFLNNYFIKCFYEDERGRIWFGTQNNGLNIFDPRDRSVKNYPAFVKSKGGLSGIVSSVFKDAAGNMWVGSSLGICLFDEKSGTFKPIDISVMPTQLLTPAGNFVIKFKQLQNGELLVCTSLGLYNISRQPTGEFKVVGVIDKRLQGLSIDVVEMGDKSLYVGVPGSSLYQFKKNGNAYNFAGGHLSHLDIRSLHADERDKNKLWVSSSIGLIEYNTGNNTFITYKTANGLANDYVYGVLEDKEHNFWISTNGGLSYFDRKKKVFQNYTASDGLQSNEFNTAAYYKSAKGTMYFGGIKGFNWFNPENLYTGRHKPGVAVTAVLVDDKLYAGSAGQVTPHAIEVPYDKNSLSVSFAALDYTMPSANKIAYMLRGLETNWVITTNKNVRYAKLLPGHYTFLVKAANGDGVWSDVEAVSININAPFWQQTWFYVTCGFLVIGGITYLTWLLSQLKIKRRLRLLERRHAIDAERNRISRDMHDEIGSGLTHIALLSELIQTQYKTDAAVKNDVGNISASARKLITNMSEIIWALNPQNDSLENLLAYTREQMQQYFEPFDMVLQIDFADTVPHIPLTNEQRRNLYLVTKEALNNTMKHARASLVKLSFEISGTLMVFTICDNGCGLPYGCQKPNSNGLKNMQKRMEDIGGQLQITNSLNGLSVCYTLCLPK
nr:sensor histidine kinase [uncultured Mucilaginibacter sp.]